MCARISVNRWMARLAALTSTYEVLGRLVDSVLRAERPRTSVAVLIFRCSATLAGATRRSDSFVAQRFVSLVEF